MSHSLPSLPYEYDALEPQIDAKTMEIHHSKHHQTYVTNLNDALAGTEWSDMPLDELMTSLDSLPADKQKAVRNNGGGHYNHSFFWPLLKAGSDGQPVGDLAAAIDRDFGSFEAFKEEFTKAALGQFGSGWAWLVADTEGKLTVMGTPNQDNPLMNDAEAKPVIGLDVWEHAYYLNYQNRRPDYVVSFWDVVNWEQAEENYKG